MPSTPDLRPDGRLRRSAVRRNAVRRNAVGRSAVGRSAVGIRAAGILALVTLASVTVALPTSTPAAGAATAKATKAAKAPGEDLLLTFPSTPREGVAIDYGAIRKITGITFDSKEPLTFKVIRFLSGGGYFTVNWAMRGSKQPNGWTAATAAVEVTNHAIGRDDEITLATGIDPAGLGTALTTAGFTSKPGATFATYAIGTTADAAAPFSGVRQAAIDAKRRLAIVARPRAATAPSFDVMIGSASKTGRMQNDRDIVELFRRSAGAQVLNFFEPPGDPAEGFPKASLFGVSTTFDATGQGHQRVTLVYRSAADASAANAALAKALASDDALESFLGDDVVTVSERTLTIDAAPAETPTLSAPILVYLQPFPLLRAGR